jgi:hypothetical protein
MHDNQRNDYNSNLHLTMCSLKECIVQILHIAEHLPHCLYVPPQKLGTAGKEWISIKYDTRPLLDFTVLIHS